LQRIKLRRISSLQRIDAKDLIKVIPSII
jgi:hypothetical protein